jgi:hypothetical protein
MALTWDGMGIDRDDELGIAAARCTALDPDAGADDDHLSGPTWAGSRRRPGPRHPPTSGSQPADISSIFTHESGGRRRTG